MSVLLLSRGLYDELRAHGEETYPHECCGALLGTPGSGGWHVTKVVRAGNTRTDSAHNRYSISPLELVRIERDARQHGLEIAGFYHSHPDHPAQWSKTDFEEAHWLGCVYVITTVAKGKADVTNCFLLSGASEEEKQFQNISIEVRD
ncbi:M67 family metallopeptidase [Acidicapsa dinghuensis]|uniref:M67 family metallopeptidase n=1 Tax=Acidicapsa dinghuensis TaxID=2218256 RepID=A0ABW1EB46_9BACT|nr:M67 family metallopeptidase [Acidicapsa dinghuensis]